jgi:hypothetical protein
VCKPSNAQISWEVVHTYNLSTGRQKQEEEDHKFKASLCYILRLVSKKKQTNKK